MTGTSRRNRLRVLLPLDGPSEANDSTMTDGRLEAEGRSTGICDAGVRAADGGEAAGARAEGEEAEAAGTAKGKMTDNGSR
jgi:hypothetical protein|tara:strand:- start:1530 stop:1772 length:243 start_codon:yes stop_codon:yes gene_type:complete